MACTNPHVARYDGSTVHFGITAPAGSEGIVLPCEKCQDCRIRRARDWSVRCVHEAQLHDRNCFLTLTYDDEHLPADRGLVKKHVQDFLKRLRRRLPPGRVVRYLAAGEYGTKQQRPHYHLLLFGEDFLDGGTPEQFETGKGSMLYTAERMRRLWRFGFHSIGMLTPQSARYTAQYTLKKQAQQITEQARHLRTDGKKIWSVPPEFLLTSRRPGLGARWFERYWRDVYPNDFVLVRNKDGYLKRCKPPRYYDLLLQGIDFEMWEHVLEQRKKHAPAEVDFKTLRNQAEITRAKMKAMASRDLDKVS